MTSPVTQSLTAVYPCSTQKTSYDTAKEETLQILQDLTTEPHTDQYGCSDEHFSSDPLKYFVIFAGVAIMFENLTLIIVICRTRSLYSITNILVASMAITDFAVGCQCVQLGLLAQAGGMRSWLGLRGEKMHLFLSVTVSMNTSLALVSLLHMCLLALDRYLYVLIPFRYERLVTRRRVLATAFAVWTLGLVFVAVVVSKLQEDEYRKICVLSQTPLIFTYWPLIAVYILCLVVVLTCTLGIAKLALKQSRKRKIRNMDMARSPGDTEHCKTRKVRGGFCDPNHNSRATGSGSNQGTAENADTNCCNKSENPHSSDAPFDPTRCESKNRGVHKDSIVSNAHSSFCENTKNKVPNTSRTEISTQNNPKDTSVTAASFADRDNTIQRSEKIVDHISSISASTKTEATTSNVFVSTLKSSGRDKSTVHFSQNNLHCNDSREENKLFNKANLKLIKFVLVLFGSLFVCTAPSIIIITVAKFFKLVHLPGVLIRLMQVLLISNSCMNFFIISYMNKDFRKALIHHLPCCVICCSRKRKCAGNV
ncbi:beta-1 adrenergic receptor [Plakobranchus ocellatus]|uniref:Beta-1 adrenergic receptor n=1 Tax=Plakobranchus ocellatus TaxID=259542 RepID=A0AAV4BNC9_9GAST|nr:beta-1 adrenergic receptor [Plakobranchus ocellatus]